MTDFFLSFWPFWLLVIEESCLPFTDVLPQFRAKVTRKSGIFESGTPRVRLRQPAFVPQSRDYGESRGFGVTGVTRPPTSLREALRAGMSRIRLNLETQEETKVAKVFRNQVRSGSIFVCFVNFC